MCGEFVYSWSKFNVYIQRLILTKFSLHFVDSEEQSYLCFVKSNCQSICTRVFTEFVPGFAAAIKMTLGAVMCLQREAARMSN